MIVVYFFDGWELWWKSRSKQWILRAMGKEGGKTVYVPHLFSTIFVRGHFRRNKQVRKPAILW